LANYQLYTRQAAMEKATVIKTSLATSKVRFFQSTLSVSQNTTKVELVAAEADFSGYTAAGYALTAWGGPVKNAAGGAIITSPAISPAVTDPDPDPIVGNTLGGWWVEDTSGDVRLVGVFDQPIPMNAVGDGFTWITQIVEAFNAPVV